MRLRPHALSTRDDPAPDPRRRGGRGRRTDAGAPSTTLSLPVPFTMTPVAAMTGGYSRAQPVTVNWTTPAANLDPETLTASGDCINKIEQMLSPDALTYTFAANTIVKR